MKRNLFMLGVLCIGAVRLIHAEVPQSTGNDVAVFRKCLSKADVIHLDGAVTVQRESAYQVKWNSAELLSTHRKDFYGERNIVGGTNKSSAKLTIVALIPFYEYRGTENPGRQIKYVTVNGKRAKCFMFSAGESSAEAIRIAKLTFPNEKLFESQLSSTAPLLFIDAGEIGVGDSVKIEYEKLPCGPIKIN
jgi:hypothetical protein